jgi:hypothetical protein
MKSDDFQRLLGKGEIRQSLMAAPLWKYMAEHKETNMTGI